MFRKIITFLLLCAMMCLPGCCREDASEAYAEKTEQENDGKGDETEMDKLIMKIDGETVAVEWEDNESIAYLYGLCHEAELEIHTSRYGGFEQVGPIGLEVPEDDHQLTTSPGDIVLYSGNQMVLFFGSNSWSYTRLGKITGLTDEEIAALLDKEGVTLELVRE